MSPSLQLQVNVRPVPSMTGRNLYERAFVQTVLRLRGVDGVPSPLQAAIGKKILNLRGLKIAIEQYRQPAFDPDTAASGHAQEDGVKQAFMLVRFDSVLPPDAQQLQALNDWLEMKHAAD